MKVSDRGVAEIASHEGIVLNPYKDSVGVWTVGIGHTKAAGPPDPSKPPRAYTLEEVMAIFRRDIAKFEHRVHKAVKVPLRQHEFDALVSFDFNTGGIFRARLTQKLNAGDRKGAAKAFMGWLRPPEIKGRRMSEMRLFKAGQYGEGIVTIYTADRHGKVQWNSAKHVALASMLKQPHKPVENQTGNSGGVILDTLKHALVSLLSAFKQVFKFLRSK